MLSGRQLRWVSTASPIQHHALHFFGPDTQETEETNAQEVRPLLRYQVAHGSLCTLVSDPSTGFTKGGGKNKDTSHGLGVGKSGKPHGPGLLTVHLALP